MPNAANEEIARRAIDVFNTGDMSEVDALTAPDAVGHDPAQPEDQVGRDGFKQVIEMYRGGFPDIEMRVEDQISDGDMVVTRWSSSGTNSGSLGGMPPTGKRIETSGITIDKIADGQIVESWTQWDNMGLMQQLGIGAPAGAEAN